VVNVEQDRENSLFGLQDSMLLHERLLTYLRRDAPAPRRPAKSQYRIFRAVRVRGVTVSGLRKKIFVTARPPLLLFPRPMPASQMSTLVTCDSTTVRTAISFCVYDRWEAMAPTLW
jgi:hypothetical protein